MLHVVYPELFIEIKLKRSYGFFFSFFEFIKTKQFCVVTAVLKRLKTQFHIKLLLHKVSLIASVIAKQALYWISFSLE